MLIPVRCFSCGSLVGDKYEKFRDLVNKGMEKDKALNELGVKRYCCRRMILGNFEVIDQLLPFSESVYSLREPDEDI